MCPQNRGICTTYEWFHREQYSMNGQQRDHQRMTNMSWTTRQVASHTNGLYVCATNNKHQSSKTCHTSTVHWDEYHNCISSVASSLQSYLHGWLVCNLSRNIFTYGVSNNAKVAVKLTSASQVFTWDLPLFSFVASSYRPIYPENLPKFNPFSFCIGQMFCHSFARESAWNMEIAVMIILIND